MRPEIYGALSLAVRHLKTAENLWWFGRGRKADLRRMKHLNKARKLQNRAARMGFVHA